MIVIFESDLQEATAYNKSLVKALQDQYTFLKKRKIKKKEEKLSKIRVLKTQKEENRKENS